MNIKRRVLCLAFIVVLAILTSSFTGCMNVDRENRTVFELREDGSIVQEIVDDADGSITGEELENYINESIASFQSVNSSDSVALETCRVGNGKINITLVYSSASAYSAFNNVTCFTGTIKEAYNAGYDFNRSFYSLNGTSIPYFELPKYSRGCMVLIMEEPCEVRLPGELYIISEGVTQESDGGITIDAKMDESYNKDIQTTTAEPVFLIYTVQ